MIRSKVAALALGITASLCITPGYATPVGLELALLVDVSGSVDSNEFSLQQNGYRDAFLNPALVSAIQASELGSIAVTYIQWSSASQQAVKVPWTLVNDATTATTFANAVGAASRSFSGLTAPGSAINFTTPRFGTETGGAANGFESLRQVIDVSGDGSQNDGASTLAARNAALAAGVDAINGLPILGSEGGLLTWYQNNIQSPNGFTIAASSFDTFGAAILSKLTREITNGDPLPAPSSLLLTCTALLALFATRRRSAV